MIDHFHWDTNTTSLWKDHATATNWVARDVRTWVRTWSAPSRGYAWMTKGDTTSQSPRRSNTEFLTTGEGPAHCKHGETWTCWGQFLEILQARNKLKFNAFHSFFFFLHFGPVFRIFFFVNICKSYKEIKITGWLYYLLPWQQWSVLCLRHFENWKMFSWNMPQECTATSTTGMCREHWLQKMIVITKQ